MGAPVVHARLVTQDGATARYRLVVAAPEPVEVGALTLSRTDVEQPTGVFGGPSAEAAASLVAGKILVRLRHDGEWPAGVTRFG